MQLHLPPNDAHWFWLGLLLLLMFGCAIIVFTFILT
jgi:hypothetical protein